MALNNMLAGLSGVPGGLINAGMAAGIPTQYAQSPDGSFDWQTGVGALGGGLGGAAIGGLAGLYAKRAIGNKYATALGSSGRLDYLERLKKANPKLTSEHLSKLFPAEAKFTGVEKMLAKNPGVLKALPGLGAMAGLTMGSSIIGSALTGPRDAALAQQESYWQQKNAQDIALANAQAYPAYSSKSTGYY